MQGAREGKQIEQRGYSSLEGTERNRWNKKTAIFTNKFVGVVAEM